MKKFIALALAILMMAAIAVPAFAANIDETSAQQSSTAEVTYGVTETYIVTVPASVTVQKATDSTGVPISAKKVVIPGDKVLTVRVTSPTSLDWDGEGEAYTAKAKVPFEMIANNGSDNLAYKMATSAITDYANATNVVANGGICFQVESEQAPAETPAEGTLYFATAGTTQSAQYKDILTFAVALEPSTQNQG